MTAALTRVFGGAGPTEYRYDGKTDPQIVRDLMRAAGHSDDTIDARMESVATCYVSLLEQELATGTRGMHVFDGVAELITGSKRGRMQWWDCSPAICARARRSSCRRPGWMSGGFAWALMAPITRTAPSCPPSRSAARRETLGLDLRGEDLVVIGDTPPTSSARGASVRAPWRWPPGDSRWRSWPGTRRRRCSRRSPTRTRCWRRFSMREVELKAVLDDWARRAACLTHAGAVLEFGGRLEDRRYDTPVRDLARRDEVLRLRDLSRCIGRARRAGMEGADRIRGRLQGARRAAVQRPGARRARDHSGATRLRGDARHRPRDRAVRSARDHGAVRALSADGRPGGGGGRARRDRARHRCVRHSIARRSARNGCRNS